MDRSESPGKVQVNILLFAKAKDLVKQSCVVVHLHSTLTGHQILQETIEILPSLSPLSSCLMLALNQTYIELGEEIQLRNGDEIAVIPPLSGG